MPSPPRTLALLLLTACPGGGTTTADTASETTDSTGPAPVTTGDNTTGPEPAAGCDTPDPSTRADFTLDLGDVPGGAEFAVDLELPCTISAVAVEGTMITTDLTCLDDQNAMHAVEFDVAATDLGAPAWSADEPVTLRVRGAQDFGGLIEATGAGDLLEVEIAMHRDADLLASVIQSYKATADIHAPLQLSFDRDACGADLPQDDPDFPGPDRDMAVTFTLAEANLTLFTAQHGQLPATDAVLAIDVGEATAIQCCHHDVWLTSVARLVTPG